MLIRVPQSPTKPLQIFLRLYKEKPLEATNQPAVCIHHEALALAVSLLLLNQCLWLVAMPASAPRAFCSHSHLWVVCKWKRREKSPFLCLVLHLSPGPQSGPAFVMSQATASLLFCPNFFLPLESHVT